MDLRNKVKILNNYLQAKNFNKVIEEEKSFKKIPNNDFILNLIGMATR